MMYELMRTGCELDMCSCPHETLHAFVTDGKALIPCEYHSLTIIVYHDMMRFIIDMDSYAYDTVNCTDAHHEKASLQQQALDRLVEKNES